MAFAKNIRTGKIASVPDHYIGHPVFGGDLILVGSEPTVEHIKEKKKKNAASPLKPVLFNSPAKFEPIQEQEAPKTNIEDEEYEDGN
jgi:hypothetical protein